MIVTFFGHTKIPYGNEVSNKLSQLLEEKINGQDVTFYLGCNGRFDGVALYCCVQYKEKHGNARLAFVTPSTNEKYLKSRKNRLEIFDEIVYPDLENAPTQSATVDRNRYMVRQSDLVICYVQNKVTNSSKLMDYAISLQKPYYNLYSLN